MAKKYDSKKVKHKKSAELIKQKRTRRLIVLGWLLVSITVGALFYNGYAKKHMSDTPMVSVTVEDGVSTGTELLENVEFGPWNGNKFDIKE